MLRGLRAASGNVVLILDASHSGAATRAPSGSLVARFQRPLESELSQVESHEPSRSDSTVALIGPASGQLVLSAHVDGSNAFESGGNGVFTRALVSALSELTPQPLTYRQLSRKLAPQMAATGGQIAQFDGELDRVVFDVTERKQPLGMKVLSVGPTIKLSGTVLPGFGANAELRVFDGALTGTELNDPAKSKAQLVVTSSTTMSAEARLVATPKGAAPIQVGDLALLMRPSDENIAVQARIRPPEEPLGVPVERAAQLQAALNANRAAALLVTFHDDLSDFEVTMDASGSFNVLGPDGSIRNVASSAQVLVEDLWLHARQRALLSLRPEGGTELRENESIIVNIQPSIRSQGSCTRNNARLTTAADETVVIPLCYSWQIRVKLAPEVKTPLRVGGLVLSSDGSVFGFPRSSALATLQPGGGEVVFDTIFTASPPIGVRDYVMVFGTQPDDWVDWREITSTIVTRNAGDARTGSLHRALRRYTQAPGSRGEIRDDDVFEGSPWTRTTLRLRTEANPVFAEGTATALTSSRYSFRGFDIRPYLPDDRGTFLYRLLRQADELAVRNVAYRAHDWSAGTDEENLAIGLDPSRAIWFAFTRAGLAYTIDDKYVTTAEMARPDSAMTTNFDACPIGGGFETGDLLVYRDDKRGDGYVVMVIDPARLVAWASVGWDAKAAQLDVPPDTGVEYLLILNNADSKRWDRKDLRLTKCWRSKEIAAERARGLGVIGRAALGEQPCGSTACK
jgi:hypothetical protein